jgi:predicted lysophospholipase L1 biosynthesis ABC-type transport system permease subunit
MDYIKRLIEYNVVARLTMICSIAMSWRCAEWFMSLPPEAQTTGATTFVSVIMGVMTGIFGIWMGQESRGKRND